MRKYFKILLNILTLLLLIGVYALTRPTLPPQSQAAEAQTLHMELVLSDGQWRHVGHLILPCESQDYRDRKNDFFAEVLDVEGQIALRAGFADPSQTHYETGRPLTVNPARQILDLKYTSSARMVRIVDLEGRILLQVPITAQPIGEADCQRIPEPDPERE